MSALGPWVINPHSPCEVLGPYPYAAKGNRGSVLLRPIAQVWGETGALAKRNARLIAAAPELLAALEAFLTVGYYPETRAAAAAAVAKAKAKGGA